MTPLVALLLLGAADADEPVDPRRIPGRERDAPLLQTPVT